MTVPTITWCRQVPSARIVQTCMLLVESGCKVNEPDNACNSALHLSLRSDLIEVATALAKKGGNLMLANQAGETPLSLVQSEDVVERLSHKIFDQTRRNPLLPPPKHAPGSRYLCLFIERLSVQSGEEFKTPFLTLTVYNSKQQLVRGEGDDDDDVHDHGGGGGDDVDDDDDDDGDDGGAGGNDDDDDDGDDDLVDWC
jgi:hypothetical protein